jgi:DNA-directed RNA polymerase specialized sigma24 family protein
MEREEEITALALRYREGERALLGELHSRLEPAIRGFLGRYRSYWRTLPPDIEEQDLHQQAYVALAEAALEWQPERGGSFISYFLSSFPWRIDRYLRAHTPSRRTTRFQLRSVPHDQLLEGLNGMSGLDGRDWDGALAGAELMDALPEQYALVVRLRLGHGLSFREIGSATGASRSAVHEAFGRAVSLLRSAATSEGRGPGAEMPVEGGAGCDVDAGSLRRCVEVMHRLSPGGATLPGREALCRAAGLTWREYRGIMARLRLSGCLVGRRRGSPGSLACATPEETLRRLGIGD